MWVFLFFVMFFGLLASGNVRGRLQEARRALEHMGYRLPTTSPPSAPDDARDEPEYIRLYRALTGIDLGICPRCRAGAMRPHPLPREPQPRSPP